MKNFKINELFNKHVSKLPRYYYGTTLLYSKRLIVLLSIKVLLDNNLWSATLLYTRDPSSMCIENRY